jgi:K+-sensing histidine kinase KdpD
MLMNLKGFFEKKARLGSIILGSILLGIIGYIDKVTGREISFAVLYLIAICYITWFAGRLPGVMASIASALICFFDEYTGTELVEHPIIPYWNAGGMFGVFLIVTYLLSELKIVLSKKQKNCRDHLSDQGGKTSEPSMNSKKGGK